MTTVEGTGVDVPCCDTPRLWGGMAWFPHTDEDHRWRRSRMLLSLHDRLLMRAGTLAGHVITLRFTASVAFFECSCGINGPLRVHASVARFDGQGHLYRIGRETLQRIRWCGPDPISRIPWVCNGQAPSMWCLINGALTDGDEQVIGVCDCPCGHGATA